MPTEFRERPRPEIRTRPEPDHIAATPGPPPLPRLDRRDHARALLARAAFLPAHDRELVEAVYRDGRTVSSFARRVRDRGEARRRGVRRIEPGEPCPATERSTRRRLRRLVHRMLDPRYDFVIAHRTAWPTTRRRVAMARLVQGRSMRDIADSLGLSLHTVRRHLEVVEAAFEAHAEPENGGER